MERAAVIVGPTPSFVRWSIRWDCLFRQNDKRDLPAHTFTQLRSLRECSVGRCEGRMIDGVCLHDEGRASTETARGFLIDEVLNHFGGLDLIERTCGQCPANISMLTNGCRPSGPANHSFSATKLWAGCYGWFRSVLNGVDLREVFDKLGPMVDKASRELGVAHSPWYRIWQNQIWTAERLKTLSRIFAVDHPPDWLQHFEFTDFLSVLRECVRRDLRLETQLIPQGNSDGVGWTIESHCPRCRCEMAPDIQRCGQCGYCGHPVAARTRKVLGLRPYLLLKDIIGPESTTELLARMNSGPARAVPSTID